MESETPQTKIVDSAESDKMPPKKHQDFVERYLLHFNATKAYMDTYGGKNVMAAGASATRLLKDVLVKKYLDRRLAERKAEIHIDVAYVVRKLTEIVEADYLEHANTTFTAEEIKQIPKEIRKLIQSVELVKNTNRTNTNSGDYTNTTEKYKITFMSKDAALQALGKHTGTFLKDNVSANINLDQMTFTDALKKLDI